jgi:cell division protein FtsN
VSLRIARDYADRHPRNGSRRKPARASARKPPSRGGKGGRSGLPAWAWMVLGLSLGLVVAAVVYISRPAKPMDLAPSTAEKNQPKTIELPPKEPSRFAFYEMLPSYEVVVPDEELNRPATKPPPRPAPVPASEGGVTPAPTAAAPRGTPAVAPASAAAPPPAAPPSVSDPAAALQAALAAEERSRKASPPPVVGKGERYVIQVASYRNRADADQQRAALALLGLSARVEQVTIDQTQTWYRVRLGPYADTQAAQAAQRTLQGQGLKGVVMKLPG